MGLIQPVFRRLIRLREDVGIVGKWTFAYSDGRTIKAKNKITQDGLNLMGDFFLGVLPNSNIPIWLVLGTGTVAALIGDHALTTEGYRHAKSTATRDSGTSLLRIRTYLMPTEGIGNWTEAGIVFGGTSAANTGTLINHVVPAGGMYKPAGNIALTVECRLTLTGS